jgi:hypothetical protein
MIWAAPLLALVSCGEKPEFPELKNAPARVVELVEERDYFLGKAMRHPRNSDPERNPNGWAEENRRALELFKRALDEGYGPAQDEYKYPANPPLELLDRFREASMRAALCRKRAASARR